MPFLSSDLNTLKGYDMVLSLSMEAINSQFRNLYDHPIPNGKIPVQPRPLNGFNSGPVPEYYIDHYLEIIPKQPDKLERPIAHLKGHIECPKFRISETKPNTLIMSIQFKKSVSSSDQIATRVGLNPEPTSRNKPEKLQSWLYYSAKELENEKEVLDGWTVSWEVGVSSADIGNIMDGILHSTVRNSTKLTVY